MSRNNMDAGRIRFDGASYRYPAGSDPALGPIDLDIEPGRIVLVAGPTGCGKTTLLKCLNGIIPHETAGVLGGSVRVGGLDIRKASHAELCRQAGLVFQSPDDQFVASTVEDEIAFGLENLRVPRSEMRERIADALDLVGMTEAAQYPLAALSGGERQRIAVAAVLAMRPGILALDEPISQLDGVSARAVLTLLRRLTRERGITVVLVEHRVPEVAGVCDHVVLLDRGKVVLDEAAPAAFDRIPVFRDLGLASSVEAEIRAACGLPPGTDLRRVAWRLREEPASRPPEEPEAAGHDAVRLHRVAVRYPRAPRPALDDATLRVARGRCVAVVGRNGSGKTTLLSLLSGIVRPSSGEAIVLDAAGRRIYRMACRGKIALLFQNPDIMLGAGSVRSEIAFGPRHLRLPTHEIRERTQQAAAALQVDPYLDRPPESLSRGERLRVAAASLLSMRPEIMLLDEPTTGQNRANVRTLMSALRGVPGMTTVFCTHDLSTASEAAQDALGLAGGRVAGVVAADRLVADASLMRACGLADPPVARLCRDLGLEPEATVDQFLRRYAPFSGGAR